MIVGEDEDDVAGFGRRLSSGEGGEDLEKCATMHDEALILTKIAGDVDIGLGGGLDAGQVDPFDGGVGSVTGGAEDEGFDAGSGIEGSVEPGRLAGDAGGGEDPLG